MAVYEYTAKDEQGNSFTGIYNDVSSVAMLRQELSRMGDTLIRAKRQKKQSNTHVKISQDEVVTFTYRLAAMCSAGLSIIKSLETLEEQTENPSFKSVIADVRQSVATGSSLKNAFEKHRKIFSNFFIGMVDAGESSGKISETLEMSAVYLEKNIDFKRKLKAAFVYPAVVGVISIAAIAVLLIFVVPIFMKLYKQLHLVLPGPTQVLVTLSVLINDWWWLLLTITAGAIFFSKVIMKKPYFIAKWDAFKLKMPIFAELNQMIVVTHFIRTFAILVSAGVPLIKSLEVASLVVHNAKVTEIANQLQQSVKAGNPVAEAFKEHDIFPPMVVQLAESGEQSGALSEMLNKAAGFLDKDIDRTIKAMLVKIEPAITVIMGIVVGFILLAVYLPMFDYMAQIK